MVFLEYFNKVGDVYALQGDQVDCEPTVTGDVSYLHPELLVEQVGLQLGLDHDALAAGVHLDGDVDRGGKGRQLEEVVEKPPQSVLRNQLLVTKIHIPDNDIEEKC